MHARPARGALRSAAIVATVAGTLTWAPAATAQPSEPTPSSPAAVTETPALDAGSIAITTKDTTGDALTGAEFLLLDSGGQEAGRGKTDGQGKLTFPDLAPGVYRLKETASSSPLHDVVADQDVIVTPGAATRLTVTDPFKAAHLVLKAVDAKTGAPLAGAMVNIGTDNTSLLTLTTGPKGTTAGDLPMNSSKTSFWATQTKAPTGYRPAKATKLFTTVPGTTATVTFTNSKKTTTPPAPDTPGRPADKPIDRTPTTNPHKRPADKSGNTSTPEASTTQTKDAHDLSASSAPAGEHTASQSPTGSLAHTGTDATPWLLGGAGVLILSGAAAVVAARRRPDPSHGQDHPADN
ncbi:LPXTG cell wall anchor domain-containing protein [Streptomyces murinus]|uniref:MSCRAMM family protein n=1 Tax=Streptomyces murinus TaxID=33900 RepID=UPI003D66FF29